MATSPTSVGTACGRDRHARGRVRKLNREGGGGGDDITTSSSIPSEVVARHALGTIGMLGSRELAAPK